MSDAGGLPYYLKSDLMIEVPVPRRNDSSDRSKSQTFRQLTVLFDDISQMDEYRRQGFELSTSEHDLTGNAVSSMNKADYDNILERMKNTTKNEKDRVTQEEMATFRVELELRRAFLDQKHSPFKVVTPSVVKSVDSDRTSRPVAFVFGCKQISDVRKFQQPFVLLRFLTEFCEEMLKLLSENKTRTQRELMNELGLLRTETDYIRAAGERVPAREQARQCFYEISLAIAKSMQSSLANSVLRGMRACADQLANVGLFQKKDTSANFAEFVKIIANDDKQDRPNQKTTRSISDKLREVIRIVRLFHKLNQWSAFHVSKDVTRSLTNDELEHLRFQSQKFKVIYTPIQKYRDANTSIEYRVPEVLTTPDIIALVRQFDSKFCRLLSGEETDMNAYYSTYRDSKGNYRLFRTAPASLTINRLENLSGELQTTASKNIKVGIALYDSWSRALEMKSVSNIILHPKTTGTEGDFLTPARVVSSFYTEFSMMTKVNFDDDDQFMKISRFTIGDDMGNEPVTLTRGVNPKQQEAFAAAIQQFNDCLLRYDLDLSQKTLDDFNSRKDPPDHHKRQDPAKIDFFDVLNTPLHCGDKSRTSFATPSYRPTAGQSDTPQGHLMFVPVLQSIVDFIQKRDEFDLFIDPLCSNSYVLTQNTCLALVAIDSCDHRIYVYDPTSPDNTVMRHQRLLAIIIVMLSMSVKFRKPYAISAYTTNNAFSSSFYTIPQAKSKKAWFDQLLQLAEVIVGDYMKTKPAPMMYHNSKTFLSTPVSIKYTVEKQTPSKDKKPSTITTSEEESEVKIPVISAVLSCRYAEYLVENWTSSHPTDSRAKLLSPDAFIGHEMSSSGAGASEIYLRNTVKSIFGAVFRVPKTYVPTQFGKKNNNKGQGRGRGRGQGQNRGRGRGRGRNSP